MTKDPTKEVLEEPNSNFLNCDTTPPTDASICKMDSWDSWQNTSQWLKHIVRGVVVGGDIATTNNLHRTSDTSSCNMSWLKHRIRHTIEKNNVLKQKNISLTNRPMLLPSTAHTEPVTQASATKHDWTKWNTVKCKWARLFFLDFILQFFLAMQYMVCIKTTYLSQEKINISVLTYVFPLFD